MEKINSDQKFNNFTLVTNLKKEGTESIVDVMYAALLLDMKSYFNGNNLRSTPGSYFEDIEDIWIHAPILPETGTLIQKYESYADSTENVWYDGFYTIPFVKSFIYSL